MSRTSVALIHEPGTTLPHTLARSRPRSVNKVRRVLVRDTPRTPTWSAQRLVRVSPEVVDLFSLRHRGPVHVGTGVSGSPPQCLTINRENQNGRCRTDCRTIVKTIVERGGTDRRDPRPNRDDDEGQCTPSTRSDRLPSPGVIMSEDT